MYAVTILLSMCLLGLAHGNPTGSEVERPMFNVQMNLKDLLPPFVAKLLKSAGKEELLESKVVGGFPFGSFGISSQENKEEHKEVEHKPEEEKPEEAETTTKAPTTAVTTKSTAAPTAAPETPSTPASTEPTTEASTEAPTTVATPASAPAKSENEEKLINELRELLQS